MPGTFFLQPDVVTCYSYLTDEENEEPRSPDFLAHPVFMF